LKNYPSKIQCFIWLAIQNKHNRNSFLLHHRLVLKAQATCNHWVNWQKVFVLIVVVHGEQPSFCIYIFRIVYNIMMECIIYDNYSYIRVFIYIGSISLIHPVKLKVEIPLEAWIKSKQTGLEKEAW
jgi:hypothetical protein